MRNGWTDVVIPLFNQGKYLEDAIDSLFKQREYHNNVRTKNKPRMTITVIDDCSTDDSYSLAQRIQVKFLAEGRMFSLYQNDKNMGVNFTRNEIIASGNGEFVMCLDADDYLSYNYITQCQSFMKDYDVIYTDLHLFGEVEGEVNYQEWNELQHRFKPNVHCSAMFKRTIWEATKYDEDFKQPFEDYDFWLSAAKKGFRFKHTKNCGLMYRRHKDSCLMTSTLKKREEAKERLRKKHNGYYLG